MRVYELREPRGVEAIAAAQRPDPHPSGNEILVKVRAASLNYRDLLVARGMYGPEVPVNVIPLSDCAGEVVAVGDKVSRFQVGDRVCPTFYKTWKGGRMAPSDGQTALGGHIDGVLSEFTTCSEDAAVAPPAHLSFEEAACLPCAALTAWVALFDSKSLLPGETVLTLGSGGVSTFAVQFARAAGARVIATSSSNSKLERLRALGAAETINYLERPDWERDVLKLTNGVGVDHVVEVGGAGTLPKSIACTAMGGSIHMIGVLTFGEINPLTLIQWKTLRGIFVGSRDHFEAMNRMIAHHRLQPVIDHIFDFDDALSAFRRLESAAHVGKIVIRMSP